ncbi:hypothetical protein HT031_003393 [Scenedesmus sp. PABB004]|nr:hypothetical protein HT031_003393 [Scenedesmus sp. PABB004]
MVPPKLLAALFCAVCVTGALAQMPDDVTWCWTSAWDASASAGAGAALVVLATVYGTDGGSTAPTDGSEPLTCVAYKRACAAGDPLPCSGAAGSVWVYGAATNASCAALAASAADASDVRCCANDPAAGFDPPPSPCNAPDGSVDPWVAEPPGAFYVGPPPAAFYEPDGILPCYTRVPAPLGSAAAGGPASVVAPAAWPRGGGARPYECVRALLSCGAGDTLCGAPGEVAWSYTAALNDTCASLAAASANGTCCREHDSPCNRPPWVGGSGSGGGGGGDGGQQPGLTPGRLACYMGWPGSAQLQVVSATNTHDGEALVCMSYEFNECSTSGRDCSDAELASGVWRQQLGATSAASCASMQRSPVNSGGPAFYRNVACCAENACNAGAGTLQPSALEPLTCYAGSPPFMLAELTLPAPSNASVLCASYMFNECSAPGRNCSATELASADAWAPRVGAFAASTCAQLQAAAGSPGSAVTNVTCCGESRCNAYNPAGTLSCYSGSAQQSFLMPVNVTSPYGDAMVCMSYEFNECSGGGRICSDAELASGVWRQQLGATSAASCASMQRSPVNSGGPAFYRSVACCSTNACNMHLPGASTPQPSALEPLTCYAGSPPFMLAELTLPAPSNASEPVLCASYMFNECSAPGRNCSATELATAAAWAPRLGAFAASTCAQLQAAGSPISGVACCAGSRCNALPGFQPGGNGTFSFTHFNATFINGTYNGTEPGRNLTCWQSFTDTSRDGAASFFAAVPLTKAAYGEERACMRSADSGPDGAQRWRYEHATLAACKARAAAAGDDSVLCCTGHDGCNLPDPARDNITELVLTAAPPGQERLTCFASVSSAASSSPDLAGLPPAALPARFPRDQRVRSWTDQEGWHPTVCAWYDVNRCTLQRGALGTLACTAEQLAAGGVWGTVYSATTAAECHRRQWLAAHDTTQGGEPDTRAWRCCATDACNAPALRGDNGTAVLAVPAGDSLTCLTSFADTGLPVHAAWYVTTPERDEPLACMTYAEDVCPRAAYNPSAPTCTPEQAAAGVWQTQYRVTSVAECYAEQWARSSAAASGAKAGGPIACCTTDRCNSPAPGGAADVVVVDVPVESADLTCFTTAVPAAAASPANPLHPVTTKTQRSVGSSPAVCVRYAFNACAERACSAAEQAAGAWAWGYGMVEALDCANLMRQAAQDPATYANVTCCAAAHGCNAPLDPTATPVLAGPPPPPPACPGGTYVTAVADGAAVNITAGLVAVDRSPTGPAYGTYGAEHAQVFVNVSVAFDPSWTARQQQLGDAGEPHALAWTAAMLPLLPAPYLPPPGAGVPPPAAFLRQQADGRCEASSIRAVLSPSHRPDAAQIFARVVNVPGAGSYLDVWMQLTCTRYSVRTFGWWPWPSEAPATPAAPYALCSPESPVGRGPGGWARATVKLTTLLPGAAAPADAAAAAAAAGVP